MAMMSGSLSRRGGLNPACEAGLEEFRVERVDDVVERVVRRNASLVGQETAQKIEPAPEPGFDEIIHAAQRRAQYHKQDFRKWVDDPPTLAGIGERRKMIKSTTIERAGRTWQGSG